MCVLVKNRDVLNESNFIQSLEDRIQFKKLDEIYQKELEERVFRSNITRRECSRNRKNRPYPKATQPRNYRTWRRTSRRSWRAWSNRSRSRWPPTSSSTFSRLTRSTRTGQYSKKTGNRLSSIWSISVNAGIRTRKRY